MRCGDLMRLSVFVCEAADTVARCAQVMRDSGIGFLPVVDGSGRLAGVVTDRDLALRVLAEDRPSGTLVGDVMTRDVVVCRPEESLRAAEDRMVASRTSRIVVVDEDDRCVGVFSLDDIAQAESRRRAGEVYQGLTRPRVLQKR